MARLERVLSLSPPKIAGSYLGFGGLWILFSDRLVAGIAESRLLATQLQTVKGWLFVLVSAALLFGLTRTRESQLAASRDRLSRATEELQVLHRIFRHNIRNDLNVVRGHIDQVRERLETDEHDRGLERAYRSTDRILGISEKLKVIEGTDLAPTGAGSVDLVDFVDGECDRLRSAYPEVVVETDLPDEAPVAGDRSLAYVVRELLENAVEHHHRPADERHITVDVRRTVGDVIVRIADDGPGIADHELEALESGEERPLLHGSGVGLWLVKWLCRCADAQVTFENGTGTTATLTFRSASTVDQLIDRARSELPMVAEA